VKVLFDNKVKDATITALAPDANYPASNLAHIFAKVKYKGVGFSDTITCLFEDDRSVDSFWYTYTNATAMEVRLYSSASVLLDTITVDCSYDSGAEYFTQIDGVRWIEIDVSCGVSSDIYLGSVALGLAYSHPLPVAVFDRAIKDNSGKSESLDGQTAVHYIKPLTAYQLRFAGVLREDYHETISKYESSGRSHIWLDITEEAHDIYKPMYCTSEIGSNITSSGHRIAFEINYTEAR